MTGTPTATAQVEEQLRPFAELEDERQRLRHAPGALPDGQVGCRPVG
jgi:hypothetical protein